MVGSCRTSMYRWKLSIETSQRWTPPIAVENMSKAQTINSSNNQERRIINIRRVNPEVAKTVSYEIYVSIPCWVSYCSKNFKSIQEQSPFVEGGRMDLLKHTTASMRKTATKLEYI